MPPGWHLHRHEFRNSVRMSVSQSPSHACAPVVRHNGSLVLTEIANQAEHILHEQFNSVAFNSSGLVAEIVAAHVRSNDVISFAQDWQLMSP